MPLSCCHQSVKQVLVTQLLGHRTEAMDAVRYLVCSAPVSKTGWVSEDVRRRRLSPPILRRGAGGSDTIQDGIA